MKALVCSMQAQGRSFTIFIIEQSTQFLFNRGALLNAGFQLLQGSDYDHFAFQDVDTLPTERGHIQYTYPVGIAPLHLSPFGFHPAANFAVRTFAHPQDTLQKQLLGCIVLYVCTCDHGER